MSNSNLPCVEDLEKSPQWTSLADEILYLERMCHLNNHRHARKQVSKFPGYQKHSVPQVQKATSVWIEPSDELYENVESKSDLPKAIDETYHWSWRPKTEFERTYFYDDYNRNQFQDDMQKRHSSLPCNESFEQSVGSQRSNERQEGQNPAVQAGHRRFFNEDKLSQVYNRINEHYNGEASYSGTRERLHEIFERNRYLRRKFFSSIPDNDATNCANDFSKSFNNKNSSTISKYSGGFGSTETLTSQSNQSSISSTNDRKSRAQVNFTPELIEEERCAGEFPQRNDYKNTLISSVSDIPGVHITSTTNDSKLLVNILPGNEIYVLKEPTNYHNSIPMQNYSSNSMLMSEHDLPTNRNANIDDVKQYNRSISYAPNVCTVCCEQLSSREEITQGRGPENDFKAGSINGAHSDRGAAENQTMYGGFISETPNEKLRIENIKMGGEGSVEPQDSKYSHQFLSDYESKTIIHEPKYTVQVDNCYELSNNNDQDTTSWTKQNDLNSQQNLCASLPNLALPRETSNSSCY
ncbi:uncharacterized protein LOC143184754 [Calliopsis andreniformis]|uniref:uncharacterized protein LOC143184754 n=1 Tax=Calliopsis andreniformis TaxID=337506 RepID=UPI003FCCA1D7